MKYLDCTLRDGGYYTNWDFDKELVENYILSLNKLPIDIIEVGYRSVHKKEYFGEYFYCPISTLQEIHNKCIDKKISIMLNEKDTPISIIDNLLNPISGIISVIRIAVQPDRFEQALKLSEVIKTKGFDVGFNLMYMSKLISNKKILDNIHELNNVVDYFYLVDSYGGVYPNQVKQIVEEVKSKININIGFHGHNNLELAFINSITAIEAGCSIIDGTITGMGRGAGNLKTELFLTWLASKGMNINFNSLAEIVSGFERLQKEHQWGTNLPYMVSGSNSLPQKDIMDWLTKRTYSMNSIVSALQSQKQGDSGSIKLPVFNSEKKFNKALLIAGGPSAIKHSHAIKQWIMLNKENLVVLHVSSRNSRTYEDLEISQIYCLVGSEGKRLETIFNNANLKYSTCVLPPSPRIMGTYIPENMKNISCELSDVSFTDLYKDSHTAISLQTALNLGVSECYCVGFDGYTGSAISQKEQDLVVENDYLFKKYSSVAQRIISLTPSRYQSLTTNSVYGLITN